MGNVVSFSKGVLAREFDSDDAVFCDPETLVKVFKQMRKYDFRKDGVMNYVLLRVDGWEKCALDVEELAKYCGVSVTTANKYLQAYVDEGILRSLGDDVYGFSYKHGWRLKDAPQWLLDEMLDRINTPWDESEGATIVRFV